MSVDYLQLEGEGGLDDNREIGKSMWIFLEIYYYFDVKFYYIAKYSGILKTVKRYCLNAILIIFVFVIRNSKKIFLYSDAEHNSPRHFKEISEDGNISLEFFRALVRPRGREISQSFLEIHMNFCHKA